jgi:hypothetical protein
MGKPSRETTKPLLEKKQKVCILQIVLKIKTFINFLLIRSVDSDAHLID